MLTKKPISPSSSTRVRPATGVPISTSSCPVQRESSAANPAATTAKSVVPWLRASARSPATSGASSRKSWPASRPPAAAGRGWSTGSSSSEGAPASRSLQ
jgi:hypothetical protein